MEHSLLMTGPLTHVRRSGFEVICIEMYSVMVSQGSSTGYSRPTRQSEWIASENEVSTALTARIKGKITIHPNLLGAGN